MGWGVGVCVWVEGGVDGVYDAWLKDHFLNIIILKLLIVYILSSMLLM